MKSIPTPILALAAAALTLGILHAEEPERVFLTYMEKVSLEIEKDTLKIHAAGQAPTSGYSKPRLVAAASYEEPPEDGILDCFFLINPPTSDVTLQVMTPFDARLSIKKFRNKYPWIQGVRVHGKNGSVVQKLTEE